MTARDEFLVGIVGTSLVDRSPALALAQANVAINVPERSSAGTHGGWRIGRGCRTDAKGDGGNELASRIPRPDRDTTGWNLLRDWLEGVAPSRPSIKLYHDATVTEVIDQGSAVEVETLVGRCWAGDVVIGADGVHSTVRRFVDHD